MPGARGRGVIPIIERKLLAWLRDKRSDFARPLTGGHFFALVLVSFLCEVTVSGMRD
ncbi:MAG: hypothetical protein QOD67_944 [Caballeronia sp.]|jgi:hypothetical protein|nr:hypothetical protein [Caballeronia sp.]